MVSKSDIQLIKSLSDKKNRTAAGLFVVEGPKMVQEAIASALKVERVIGVEQYAGFAGIEITGAKELGRMSSLRTPQGIIALVRVPGHKFPAKPGSELTLALDGVQDPGNMGTILRLADWFGISDVICSPDTADCYNPKVVQASMGAVLRVRTHYCDLPEVLQTATGSGIPVYGTFLEGEDLYTARIENPSQGIIVMGSEGKGIRPGTGSCVTRKLYIPPYPAQKPSSESLNVGTAAAIICSEFRRRIR